MFKTEDEIRDFLDELGRRGVIIPLTSKKLLIMRAYLEEKEDYIDLILERVIPSVSVVIFGAGHVGRAVAQISTQMGWDIIIIDDRIEFLEQVDESSGKVKKIGQYFEDAFRDMRLNYTSALVIVTRGHQFDQICLEASLKTDAFYIGMIGSRRRVGSIFKELERKGVSRQRLSEVHAPIGLDIGAKTPQEIAVSIVAEIIRFKNLSVDREIEEST
ncbi:MAG TPA: XdhC family protein [Blastocatellia bacterium]|nr:XdhC family protein [Blastocatellia bacterium]